MQNKKVLLLGSYGQTNVGDDLLMWNYLTFLKERGFTEIYVNANDAANLPEPIQKAFPKLVIVPTYRTRIVEWVRLLKTLDFMVYGGGTVYKELYSSTGRGKYSVIMRIMAINLVARLLGVRIYHMHIGIGVLPSWLGRMITRIALLTSTMTIFRDTESFIFARDILKLPDRIICQATDGLFLETKQWQKPWRSISMHLPSGRYKRVVGVNVLSDIPDWVNRSEYLKAIRTFINDLLADNTFVLLLPFQHDFNANNDREFMRREVIPHLQHPENYILVEQLPIDQIVAYFQKIDIFVGMRFHSLLLATVTETPFVGISYDTKCSRFMEESKYPYNVPLAGMQTKDIQQAYNSLVRDLPKIPTILRSISKIHQEKGQKCCDKLEF